MSQLKRPNPQLHQRMPSSPGKGDTQVRYLDLPTNLKTDALALASLGKVVNLAKANFLG